MNIFFCPLGLTQTVAWQAPVLRMAADMFFVKGI